MAPIDMMLINIDLCSEYMAILVRIHPCMHMYTLVQRVSAGSHTNT